MVTISLMEVMEMISFLAALETIRSSVAMAMT